MGSFLFVTALHEFHGIYEVLRDGPPFDEAGLVKINEFWDFLLQPGSEYFCYDLQGSIL